MRQPTLELGKKIYNTRCYFCHGYSGDAKTQAAVYMTPKPRAFVRSASADLSLETMVWAVSNGIQDTAMQGFSDVLSEHEIVAVVNFVWQTFIIGRRENTQYHTVKNGWYDHDRYDIAFPYVNGQLTLSQPDSELTSIQRDGKQLFLSSCITCHEPNANGNIRLRYGRFEYGQFEQVHDQVSVGERLFQQNCQACHARDGSGENWIGNFLKPSLQDLRDPVWQATMTVEKLNKIVTQGVENTTMPAWQAVFKKNEIAAVVDYVLTLGSVQK